MSNDGVSNEAKLKAVADYVSAKKPSLADVQQQLEAQNPHVVDDLVGTGVRRDGSRSANAGEAMDSYVGAPVRTAISQAQDGNFNMDGAKAVFNSIGADPKKAPTGVDIASKVTNNPYVGTAIATAADLAQLPVPGMGVGVPGVINKLDGPLMHGTNAEFALEHMRPSRGGMVGPGVYMTENPNTAKNFGDRVIKADVQSPKILDLHTDENDMWQAAKELGVEDALKNNRSKDLRDGTGRFYALQDALLKKVDPEYKLVGNERAQALQDALKARGYNGLAYNWNGEKTYNIFDPKTLKDAGGDKQTAQKIIDSITSPEQAVALKGAKRAEYLQALDEVYGPKDARAKDLGKDLESPQYHGTGADIDAFQASERGTFGPGVYTTANAKEASAYANKADSGGNVIEVVTPPKSKYFDGSKGDITKVPGYSELSPMEQRDVRYSHDERAKFLKEQGYAGVTETAGREKYRNTFDPSDLRSTNAAFDPRFKDSPLLLAAKTGANVDDPKVQALLQTVAKEHKLDYNQLRKEFIEKKRELAVQDRNKSKYAEGGDVGPKERREDATPPPVPETPEERKKKTAEASQKGTSIPSATELYNRLKNAWAEGGMVDGHHMGALAMMALEEQQQGKETNPRMLAEGSGPLDAPQGPIDINSLSQINGNLPEQPDPATVEKQELYNQAIQGNDGRNLAMRIATKAMGPAGALVDTFLNKPQGSESQFVNGQPPQNFDPQAWGKAENEFNEKQIAAQKSEAQNAQALAYNNEMRARAGLPPLPSPMQQPDPKDLQTAGVMQEAAALQGQQGIAPQDRPANPMEGTDPTSMLMGGYNKRMTGINQEADELGQLGQQQAKLLDQSIKAKSDAQAHYQQEYQSLDQERQHHIQDIRDGYIDPNKYWDNHSKVAAGIGMILAGFNPTNSPNAAVNFLKFQMEQNLNAQAKNLDSKNNLLQANMRQFGNLKDATEMTRLMQNDIVTQQLQSAAAKAQNPMAKAAALKAAGQLQMEAAPMFQQFAMKRALMGLSQTNNPQAVDQMLGYLRVMNPEMAKEMEGRYVPGVGMASVPLTPEVRGKLVGMQELNTAANDLLGFVKTHTTLNPYSKEYAIGQQKALALQSMVREGKLGTVYREGEQPLLDKFVNSNPAGALKMIQTVPKLQELMHSNSMQMNTLKRSVGLPASAPPSPQASNMREAALVWAKANPNDPRAAKILSMLGQK